MLKEQISSLPSSPGVYLMKDSQGFIIYVGKSKHLKQRVQSYFHNSKSHSSKVKKLVHQIKQIDHIVTDTEFEAFMLECKLIRELKPPFNKKMKNPLAYTYIVIRMSQGLRRIEITNNPASEDEYLHFGPYTANKNMVQKAVQGIEECFKIACSQPLSQQPCLNFSLGRCLGICMGGEAVMQYNDVIDSFIALLNREDPSLLTAMNDKMREAAEQYDYEKAAKYRDYIDAVNFLVQKEKVIGFTEENRNIVVLEHVNEYEIKLFLIKRNTVLFSERYTIELEKTSSLCADIKDLIMNVSYSSQTRLCTEISRDEIDEAQIIYRYLQASESRYIVIPDEWINGCNDADLDEAVLSLLHGPEQVHAVADMSL